MNIINLCNYKIYITDICYNYLIKNKKKNFGYKLYILNKGNLFSKTIIYYSKFKKNIFNKILSIKNIFIIIDILSICFLKNTCIHYKKKIFINSPNSLKNSFYENKIINKIFFLTKFIINKKLLLHNGIIKIEKIDIKKKYLFIFFLGNCKNCNISNYTLKNFIFKILKKIIIINIFYNDY